jgi:hypothetical protein
MDFIDLIKLINNIDEICRAVRALYRLLKFFKKSSCSTLGRTNRKKLPFKKNLHVQAQLVFKKASMTHFESNFKKIINATLRGAFKKAIKFTFCELGYIKKPLRVTICYLLKKDYMPTGVRIPVGYF